MNHFFTLTLLLPFASFGMDKETLKRDSAQKETVSVTESCAKAIEQINRDGPVLYYYLKGSFAAIAELNRADIEPSDLLTRFADGRMPIDDATKLQYMSATGYLQTFLNRNSEKFDAFFKEKYTETKNLTATWKAFKKYFKQEGIAKPFIALKQQLVKNDLQRQELALKGVYFHQNTVIIDLSLGQKEDYSKSQDQGKQH